MAAGISSLSGCLNRRWSLWERDSPSQVNVDILTVPEDDDLYALRIAQNLADNLQRAGIQANIVPTRHANFLRTILVNQDFDMYVWRYTPQRDPDAHRTLLHSRFVEERGWQNPYGFSNSVVDGLLEDQLQASTEGGRQSALAELQDILVSERPFIPLAFPQEHRLIRNDRISHVGDESFFEPTWLYRILASNPDAGSLQLGTTDSRLTHSLNPIGVEYRAYDGVLDLVYESPAQLYNDDHVPWLAADWEWTSPQGAPRPTLELVLRDNLRWQDGEPLTSDDVVFTYEFLDDTSMTEEDPTIPSPRYRGRMTLLETAEAVDDTTIRYQFTEASRDTVIRLLTVPVFPQHIWEEWTDVIEVAGIQLDDVTTDALVEENLEPVGSGPYEVTSVEMDAEIELTLDEEHPFVDIDSIDHPIPSIGPPRVGELVIDVRPSISNITESIRGGGLDGSLGTVGRLLRDEASQDDDIDPVEQQSQKLYHLGFNLRERPMNNSGFRTAIERLIDRQFLYEEVFQESGRLTRTSVFDDRFIPANLVWRDTDVTRFAGEPGAGEVDEEEARELFREAGFSYSEDGALLVN